MATAKQYHKKDKTVEAIGDDIMAQYTKLKDGADIDDEMREHNAMNAKNMVAMLHASRAYGPQIRMPAKPTAKQTNEMNVRIG